MTESGGLSFLTARMEEFRGKVPLLVVQNHGVDCLPETSIIVHHVKTVLPGIRKAVFYPSLCVCHRSSLSHQDKKSSYP